MTFGGRKYRPSTLGFPHLVRGYPLPHRPRGIVWPIFSHESSQKIHHCFVKRQKSLKPKQTRVLVIHVGGNGCSLPSHVQQSWWQQHASRMIGHVFELKFPHMGADVFVAEHILRKLYCGKRNYFQDMQSRVPHQS